MVEKIDKPEPPPTYQIERTVETKRDRPREERRQEDLPTFKQESPSLYQEKFQAEGGTLKTIRVPIDQIQKLLFRRATPRHGSPTAEADLVWRDGKTTEGVSFLIRNWQDFLKIKNLKHGEAIPPEFWNYATPNLEITIRQGTTSGPWNLRDIQKQNKEVAQREPADLPWWKNWKFGLYGLIAVSTVIAIIIFLATI